MNITERIVSVKRHTIGYVIGGQEYTRKQAVKLTKQGKVNNARIVASVQHGPHLIGSGASLYTLPTRLGKSNRFASLRSK